MKEHILRAEKGAADFYQAYPLGNGTLGAMIYGSWPEERIQLNHEELWSGPPAEEEDFDRRPYLNKARSLINQGEYRKAQDIIEEKLEGVWVQNYLPLGDLTMKMEGFEPESIERQLNLRDGLSVVKALSGQDSLQVEQWISKPHKLFISRLECSRAVSLHLNLEISLKTLDRSCSDDELLIFAQCPDRHKENPARGEHPFQYQGKGIVYLNGLRILDTDGTVSVSQEGIHIAHFQTLLFGFSSCTGYRGFRNPLELKRQPLEVELKKILDQAVIAGYETIKKQHLQDFHKQFDKVELSLKGDGSDIEIPTADRILRYRENPTQDPSLAELYFNYGRYLLISSSRKGSLPANLQGIWNKDLMAPWWGNWTLNINLEMNYWPAGASGLFDSNRSLMDFIEILADSGRDTARDFYGMKGWCCHHNSDIWRRTRPVQNDACWAFWPLGGLWISMHLWHHFLYTGDLDFLEKQAWPVLEGAVLFTSDWLVEDEQACLQAIPSTSPENSFYTPRGKESAEKAAVAISSAMDLSMIKELFQAFLKAAETLEKNSEMVTRAKEVLNKLQPLKLGPDGSLLEWNEPFDEWEPGHRHFSPLYSVYPESAVMTGDPAIKEGARKLFHRRLNSSLDHTGWGAAWVICLASRLDDPERAHQMLASLIGRSTADNMMSSHNLLHEDPRAALFQIDGNFGGTAGILELLVRDLPDEIGLFPALPPWWEEGSLKGYHSKNGIILDISWEKGKLKQVLIHNPGNREISFVLSLSSSSVKKRIEVPAGECFRWK